MKNEIKTASLLLFWQNVLPFGAARATCPGASLPAKSVRAIDQTVDEPFEADGYL
jgi:hypothetical protein